MQLLQLTSTDLDTTTEIVQFLAKIYLYRLRYYSRFHSEIYENLFYIPQIDLP